MSENQPLERWGEVSLLVEHHQAERVMDMLGSILEHGLAGEWDFGEIFPEETTGKEVPVRIRGFYPLGLLPGLRLQIPLALKSLGVESALQGPTFTELTQVDWTASWRERYQPLPVGQSLVIVPTWLENPYPERKVLWMDPGLAFGSGTHATTRLSLELMEEWVERIQPGNMIDIGCGSGILTIAGVLFGIQQALGVDIEADAIRVSRENARQNGVESKAEFRKGSVAELLKLDMQSSAGLVAANIIAPILVGLIQEGLGKLVAPGGVLILSGILTHQLDDLEALLAGKGFLIRSRLQSGEWYALAAEKSGR